MCIHRRFEIHVYLGIRDKIKIKYEQFSRRLFINNNRCVRMQLTITINTVHVKNDHRVFHISLQFSIEKIIHNGSSYDLRNVIHLRQCHSSQLLYQTTLAIFNFLNEFIYEYVAYTIFKIFYLPSSVDWEGVAVNILA